MKFATFLAAGLCVVTLTAGQAVIENDAQLVQEGARVAKEYERVKQQMDWSAIPIQEKDSVTGAEVQTGYYNASDGNTYRMIRGSVIVNYPPEIYHSIVTIKFSDLHLWSKLFIQSKVLKKVKKTRLMYVTLLPDSNGLLELEPRDGMVVYESDYPMINGYRGYVHAFANVNYVGDNGKYQLVNPAFETFAGLEAHRTEDPTKTLIVWAAYLDFKYPGLPEETIELYKRFNILGFLESLIARADELCSKHRTRCGTKKKEQGNENKKNY